MFSAKEVTECKVSWAHVLGGCISLCHAFNPVLTITLLFLWYQHLWNNKKNPKNCCLCQFKKVTENRLPRLPPPTQAISQPALLRAGKHGPAYGWCYQESFAGWLFPHVLAILPSSSRNNNSKKRLQLKFVQVVLLHHSFFSISGSSDFLAIISLSSFLPPKWLNLFFPPDFPSPLLLSLR